MKEIKAMIRPEVFETVYRNLRHSGYCCATVFHGEGTGRHGDPDKMNATLDFPFLHSNIVKIEMIIEEEHEDDVIKIIQQAACTNRPGDGIIYSSTIEKAVGIRTGDKVECVL